MVAKETGQPDDTLVIENIVTLSRNHKTRVEVTTVLGNNYKGILKGVVPFYIATVGSLGLYIRSLDSYGAKETHNIVPISAIESITFETEKGFLDNLIE